MDRGAVFNTVECPIFQTVQISLKMKRETSHSQIQNSFWETSSEFDERKFQVVNRYIWNLTSIHWKSQSENGYQQEDFKYDILISIIV